MRLVSQNGWSIGPKDNSFLYHVLNSLSDKVT